MATGNVPHQPNVSAVGAQAIVRQVEKQNSAMRDQGKRQRDDEAKRQRSAPKDQGSSGR